MNQQQSTGRSQDIAIGWAAMIVPLWFLVIYLVMSGLRPEFSHVHKAISELGSLDASNLWYWNVLGYILPGLVVSLLGLGLCSRFRGNGLLSIASMGLVLSGMFFSLSGIFPADMEDRKSLTTTIHIIGSLGSFVAFLVPAFLFPVALRKLKGWKSVSWPSLLLVLLLVGSGFYRSGTMPGLAQRFGFTFFFLWVGLMGYALYRNARPTLLR